MPKECRRCKVEKELDQFHKDRSRPDGLHPYCTPCRIPAIQAWKSALKTTAAGRKRLVGYARKADPALLQAAASYLKARGGLSS